MDEAKLFGLGGDDHVRVELAITSGGKRYNLAHTFHRPSAEDKKRFWATMVTQQTTGGSERNEAYLTAQERLYDGNVISVEGYDLSGGGDQDERWWVTQIPLEHKLWAVEKLLSEAGNLERETAKN